MRRRHKKRPRGGYTLFHRGYRRCAKVEGWDKGISEQGVMRRRHEKRPWGGYTLFHGGGGSWWCLEVERWKSCLSSVRYLVAEVSGTPKIVTRGTAGTVDTPRNSSWEAPPHIWNISRHLTEIKRYVYNAIFFPGNFTMYPKSLVHTKITNYTMKMGTNSWTWYPIYWREPLL